MSHQNYEREGIQEEADGRTKKETERGGAKTKGRRKAEEERRSVKRESI